MTSCGFNIFIILTVFLSFISQRGHGINVIQPLYQTVNPDGSASISCEHTEDVDSVTDVRLYCIEPGDTAKMLCQKGKTDCQNITMYQENPKKWLFIILNIGPNAMNNTYQCQITVTIAILDYTERGTPTKLLPGKREDCVTSPPHPSLPPPPLQYYLLRWILIGLVTVISLYSCVITFMYISHKVTNDNREHENSTYVEMRKAPLTANPLPNIFCG